MYRVREQVLVRYRRLHLRSRYEKKYHYWKKKRSLRPIIERERVLLRKARKHYEGAYSASDKNPLVSVIIPTWNRGEILVKRTLPSIFKQTHKNIEIVVVGDCCTDNTEGLIKALGDPRVRFFNLPERGNYPIDKKARWQVAGSVPKNKALELCQGTWIAPLDDDDIFISEHISLLLSHAQKHNLELVYGKVKMEKSPGVWHDKGIVTDLMSIQNSSTIFRSYIKLFRSDIDAWRMEMAGDVQRTIRYRETGVRIGFLDEVVAIMPLRPGQTKKRYLAEDRPDNRNLHLIVS
jgi:glycosyltransferase involved in cell wall biosynthesis